MWWAHVHSPVHPCHHSRGTACSWFTPPNSSTKVPREVCVGVISEPPLQGMSPWELPVVAHKELQYCFSPPAGNSCALGQLQHFSLKALKPSPGRQCKIEDSLSDDSGLQIPATPLSVAKPGGDLKREKLENSATSWRFADLFLFIAEAWSALQVCREFYRCCCCKSQTPRWKKDLDSVQLNRS